MSLDSLVKRNVDLAFKLIGTLAKDITINKYSEGSFDFSTGTSTSEYVSSIVVKGVVEKVTKKQQDGSHSFYYDILFKQSDVSDFGVFDTVTFDSKTYKLKTPFESDGYILKVKTVEVA